jgi:hypothetical protein
MAVIEAVKFGRHCIAADAPSHVEAGKGAAEHLPRDETLWREAIARAVQKENTPTRRAEDARPELTASPRILSQIAAHIEHCEVINKETQTVASLKANGEIDVVVEGARNPRSPL